jgi:hypothetical protein
MDYLEEMKYRKELINRVAYTKEKLTPEEKEWLQVNPAYSDKFGYPFVVKDIIKLTPNVILAVRVTLESYNSKHVISPAFIVPLRKGYIKTKHPLSGINGTVIYDENKRITFLSTMNNIEYPEAHFLYTSKIGKMSVTYHCGIKDYRGQDNWAWSGVDPGLVMKRSDLSATKIRYACTDVDHDDFNQYVFTVELIDNYDARN